MRVMISIVITDHKQPVRDHAQRGQRSREMKARLTASQKRNPRSTSLLGSLIPSNVSSQIASASSFASVTPGALGSLIVFPPFSITSASKYTLVRIPNPVFTSTWNGKDRAMSSKSSRARRACRWRSMLSAVSSTRVRRERESARTNPLKTRSSRERGPVHGWACEKRPGSKSQWRGHEDGIHNERRTHFQLEWNNAQYSHNQKHVTLVILWRRQVSLSRSIQM